MTDPKIYSTEEIHIVDAEGVTRLTLSAKHGKPAIMLGNPNADGPTAKLEIDDKGTHVRFDRPGGGNAYLFLNNLGNSGLVLTDVAGKRRLHATVAADGSSRIERLDDEGRPIS